MSNLRELSTLGEANTIYFPTDILLLFIPQIRIQNLRHLE